MTGFQMMNFGSPMSDSESSEGAGRLLFSQEKRGISPSPFTSTLSNMVHLGDNLNIRSKFWIPHLVRERKALLWLESVPRPHVLEGVEDLLPGGVLLVTELVAGEGKDGLQIIGTVRMVSQKRYVEERSLEELC